MSGLWPQFQPGYAFNADPTSERPSVATDEHVRLLHRRSLWLNENKTKSPSMWSDGEGAQYAIAGVAKPGRQFVVGNFLIPPTGNERGSITIWTYITSAGGAGTWSGELFFTSFADDRAEVQAQPTTFSVDADKIVGTTWSDRTVTVPASGSNWIVLRIYGSSDMATNEGLTGVAVFADVESSMVDGGTIPSTFPAFRHTAFAQDRPLSNYLVRTIARAQNHVLAKYPRHLGSHVIVAAGAMASTTWYRYLMRRGPQTSNVVARVYAYVSSGTGRLDLTIDAQATPPTDTSRANEPNVTSTTGAWYTLTTSAGSTANALHDIAIKATPPGGQTITVLAICIEEVEYTQTGFVYNTGGRNDPIPDKFFSYDRAALTPGAPIVATYGLSTTLQGRWIDWATAHQNAIFAAGRRCQALVGDWVYRAAAGASDAGLNATRVSYSAPAVLYRGKHTTSRGVSRIEVYVRPRKYGAANNYRGKLELYAGTGALSSRGTIVARTYFAANNSLPTETWLLLGAFAVTEDSLYEYRIDAGFMEGDGVTNAGATATDALVLEGVHIREVPTVHALGKQYFYAAGSGGAIPDNDAVTGFSSDITVPSTQEFTVRHVRLWVTVSHAALAQLRFRLELVGVSTADVADPGDVGGSSTVWSDDILGDSSPQDTLSNGGGFAGQLTTAGAWRLHVYDETAGTTGTVTSWALELR